MRISRHAHPEGMPVDSRKATLASTSAWRNPVEEKHPESPTHYSMRTQSNQEADLSANDQPLTYALPSLTRVSLKSTQLSIDSTVRGKPPKKGYRRWLLLGGCLVTALGLFILSLFYVEIRQFIVYPLILYALYKGIDELIRFLRQSGPTK
jgi:hypothetical protein